MISAPPPPLTALKSTLSLWRENRKRRVLSIWATVVLSVVCACSLVALSIDNFLVPLAVLICVGLPILLWRLPRLSLYLTLGAVCLIEIATSNSPDAITDRIPFFWNINTIFQVYAHVNFKALPINFFELFVATAGIISLFRSVFSGMAGLRGGALWKPIAVYIAFVLIAWVHGIGTGGDFKISLQEVRGQFYFFLVYLMAVNIIEERKQINGLLWTTAICIAFKGLLYTFRRYVTLHGQPVPDQGVGSHEEALLFDLFALLLGSLVLCGVRKKLQVFMAIALPLVLLGNLATNRRAGTAAIAILIPVIFMATYAGFPKRRKRTLMLAVVLGVTGFMYYQAGKNSNGMWAQPARAINSQFQPDPRDLRSNAYRDAENFNQMATIRANPLGYGYGKPFYHIAPMDSIADVYVFWDILPHNQILWIWMRTGCFGFFAFWMMMTAIVVYAARFIRDETVDYDTKAFALFALLCIGCLLVFGLLDLQLSNYRDLIFVGLWIGVLARLKDLAPPPETAAIEPGDAPPAEQSALAAAPESPSPAPTSPAPPVPTPEPRPEETESWKHPSDVRRRPVTSRAPRAKVAK